MRRIHIAIGALALVAAACSVGDAAVPTTTSTTAFVVTTTSTSPPSTLIIESESPASALEVWAPGALIGPIGDAAAGFEIETGIDVQVVATETETMLEQLLLDPGGGPDLFVGPHAWLHTLTDAGIAEPLPVKPDVVAGAAGTVVRRGTTYAAPIGLNTTVQFRNEAALGSSPTSMESLAAGCSGGPCLVLPEDSVEGHWPFFAALGGYLFGLDEFEGWDKDDVGVDTEQALAAGAVLEAIVSGAGILGDGDSTARERFIAGDAPLFWGDLEDLEALELAGVGFAVDSLPTIGGEPSPAPVEVTALWVNAFSPHKETAAFLVEQHLTTAENSSLLAIALGQAPVDVGFSGASDLVPFTQGAIVGDPVPPIPAVTLAWEELALAFSAIRQGADAESALGAAASTIRAEG